MCAVRELAIRETVSWHSEDYTCIYIHNIFAMQKWIISLSQCFVKVLRVKLIGMVRE